MAITNTHLLEERAEAHWETAHLLERADNEWAAVLGFYSCYQLARAALLSDPVFDNEENLMQIHENLRTQDKYKTKHEVHQSGKGSNGFGVNDLVHQLYNYVSQLYRTLHRGSINVRYENGLTKPLTIDTQLDIAKRFRHEYWSGRLVHAIAKDLNKLKPKLS